MRLGVLPFGQFLGTNPHWDGTDEQPPSAVAAAIELRSPLLHGLRVGKIAYLNSIVGGGRRPATHSGGDEGYDQRDPVFRVFFGAFQNAERLIKSARERLLASPTPFMNGKWQTAFARLGPTDWSILLDGIYAAHVASYPLPETDDDMIAVAGVGLYGASEHVAASLPKIGGVKLHVEQVRRDIITAADAFQGHLTKQAA